MPLLFTYGSLRRGHDNHHVLEHLKATFMEEIEIRGKLVETPYPFPALIEGTDLVKGEMYNVSDDALRRLDYFEGNPDFYQRRLVFTTEGIDVFAYYGTGVIQAKPLSTEG